MSYSHVLGIWMWTLSSVGKWGQNSAYMFLKVDNLFQLWLEEVVTTEA